MADESDSEEEEEDFLLGVGHWRKVSTLVHRGTFGRLVRSREAAQRRSVNLLKQLEEQKRLREQLNKKKVEMRCYRVPFKDFAAVPTSGDFTESPFHLVLAACKACDDYTVFDSHVPNVMNATLIFKWNSITGRLFTMQLISFLLILVFMLIGYTVMSFTAHPKVSCQPKAASEWKKERGVA